MFLSLNEVKEYCKDLGLFIAREGLGSQAIAFKTRDNKYKVLKRGKTIVEKIIANTLVGNIDLNDLLVKVEMDVFYNYDKRENEIKEHKLLVKQLKKESTKLLGRKHVVLAKSSSNNYYAIDLDTKEQLAIDYNLIADIEISNFNSTTIMTALKDIHLNRFEPNYKRQTKLFEGLGTKYGDAND